MNKKDLKAALEWQMEMGVEDSFSNTPAPRKAKAIAPVIEKKIEVVSTNFKGDTTNDAYTTGILAIKSDVMITKCSFAHHKAGAIMIDMSP
jgi:hypothetical protein